MSLSIVFGGNCWLREVWNSSSDVVGLERYGTAMVMLLLSVSSDSCVVGWSLTYTPLLYPYFHDRFDEGLCDNLPFAIRCHDQCRPLLPI